MPESSRCYLAFDLGAESGRAILGRSGRDVISIEEVHRFANHPLEEDGSVRWDVARLWHEMRQSLKQLSGVRLNGVGVDAWGVDYALLGAHGELLQNPYHYRDKRTDGIMEQVFDSISKEEIYGITGIQFMPINTLYQLYAARRQSPKLLESAHTLLTIPDLFHYWMTGVARCEFTNATTTQMVEVKSRNWSLNLMEKAGIRASLPAEMIEPGSLWGSLSGTAARGTDLEGTPVIAPGSHDTASAVAAIAAREGTAFVSSGTWSLVGTEVDEPIITAESLQLNFTNEGGVCGTTRLLKNVMGLWMLQCCRNSWAAAGMEQSFAALTELAREHPAFTHLVDPDHASFLHPENMPAAIDRFCEKTGQPKPISIGAYVRAILESLALKYAVVIREIERLTMTPIVQIRIIGGGAKNSALNQFTADATGRKVLAGPVEATALGNLAMQLLATKEVSSLREARAKIERSSPTEVFEPREHDRWQNQLQRFQQYTELTYA